MYEHIVPILVFTLENISKEVMYRTIYTICVNYLAKIKAGAGPNAPAPAKNPGSSSDTLLSSFESRKSCRSLPRVSITVSGLIHNSLPYLDLSNCGSESYLMFTFRFACILLYKISFADTNLTNSEQVPPLRFC